MFFFSTRRRKKTVKSVTRKGGRETGKTYVFFRKKIILFANRKPWPSSSKGKILRNQRCVPLFWVECSGSLYPPVTVCLNCRQMISTGSAPIPASFNSPLPSPSPHPLLFPLDPPNLYGIYKCFSNRDSLVFFIQYHIFLWFWWIFGLIYIWFSYTTFM